MSHVLNLSFDLSQLSKISFQIIATFYKLNTTYVWYFDKHIEIPKKILQLTVQHDTHSKLPGLFQLPYKK